MIGLGRMVRGSRMKNALAPHHDGVRRFTSGDGAWDRLDVIGKWARLRLDFTWKDRVARAHFITTLLASILITALAGAPSSACAQEWPARQPVRVFVALTPGSAIDLVSRLVFEQVGKQIGQTIVIRSEERRVGKGL